MELDAAQKKIILGKPFGITMVKGGEGTGKTTMSVYRALYLKSSYCLYEDEKVLVVSADKDIVEKNKIDYRNMKQAVTSEYLTLFSANSANDPDFYTIDQITDDLYNSFIKEEKVNYKLIQRDKEKSIIDNCISIVYKDYKNIKLIKEKNIDFIIDEIKWIKSSNIFSLEEYQGADRLGRKYSDEKFPRRLIKDSKARKAIFGIFLVYEAELKKNNMIDEVDKEKLALASAINGRMGNFTHIVIDDAHLLTKLQLDVLRALSNKKAYSSMMLMVNHKVDVSNGAWIAKGRKQKELGFKDTIKNYYLKKQYNYKESQKMIKKDKVKDTEKRANYLEKYTFVDLRYKNSIDFVRDTSNFKEIIFNEGKEEITYSGDELAGLPVYSNIAAGEPITINPEQQDTFYLPSYLVRGTKNCFMLKVKGDSMIGANIEDGDFVVVRRQNTAANRDIVAVDLDGNATLKRLRIGKEEVLLMPENDKYDPIPITNRQAAVIGIVVGVIKSAA